MDVEKRQDVKSSEQPAERARRPVSAGFRRLFLQLCTVGLSVNLLLLFVPTGWKPYRIRQFWTDKGNLVELQIIEKGFGPYGVVFGHHETLYEDANTAHLDPFRRSWAIAKTQPPPPSTIDSRWLMWNGWGPSCSTTSTGIGMVVIGEYFCVPYSVMIVGFALPLVWWAGWQVVRKLVTR